MTDTAYKDEPEIVCDLIRDVGVSALGHWDGCCCCGFSVRNVNVDISCGKGRDQGVWIWSNSQDYDEGEPLLRPIANEIVRQLKLYSSRGGDFPVSYHEWKR